MARKRRVWVSNLFYHIVCRGNRRDPLFRSANDFRAFFHILDKIYERYQFEITSFCLMTNHYHLQLRSPEVSQSKIMALLNKRYADYYNTKYQLSGHVFERRFFDKIIDDKEGMLAVSRYIHLNPVEARMVKRPEYYPWSSFHLYKYPSARHPDYINTSHLLNYYTGTEEEKRKLYCEFVGACHSPNFVEK